MNLCCKGSKASFSLFGIATNSFGRHVSCSYFMSGTVLGIEDTGMSKIVFALKDKLWEWLTPSAYKSCHSSSERVVSNSLDKMLIILCQWEKLFFIKSLFRDIWNNWNLRFKFSVKGFTLAIRQILRNFFSSYLVSVHVLKLRLLPNTSHYEVSFDFFLWDTLVGYLNIISFSPRSGSIWNICW